MVVFAGLLSLRLHLEHHEVPSHGLVSAATPAQRFAVCAPNSLRSIAAPFSSPLEVIYRKSFYGASGWNSAGARRNRPSLSGFQTRLTGPPRSATF